MSSKKLRDQIKQAVQAASDLRPIEIEDWGTEDAPLIIYARPMTVAMLKKVGKYANAKRGNQIETLVYTVIFSALDEHGDAIFDLADKSWLMADANSDVLAEVVMRINARDSYEAIEAN